MSLQKLLLIDDCDAIHALLRVRLRGEAVEIYSAHDGESGVAAAKALAPDLILLDVDMPQTDGFEVCRRLVSDPDTMHIPVIFLTGHATTEEKIRGLELGATDYIAKPFDVAELRARVRAALRTKYLMDLLSRKAMIDGLTGLWNRAFFEQRLAMEVSLARRNGTPLSCMLVDIDRFKLINDGHGHPFGDLVLREVAQRLAETGRLHDVTCRYGGEEFAVLAPQATAEQAAQFGARLGDAVRALELAHNGAPVPVTCSIGVAELAPAPAAAGEDGGGDGGEGLVARADDALYRAKRAGRDRVEVAAPGSRNAA